MARQATTRWVWRVLLGLACLWLIASIILWRTVAWDGRIPLMSFAALLGLSCVRMTYDHYRPVLLTALRSVSSGKVLAPVGALISLAAFSALAGSPHTPLATPGTLFIVVVAIVTTVSVVVTVSRIDDIHGRILDYEHLLVRVTAMLSDELSRVHNDDINGELIFVANVPAVGSISAPEEFPAYKRKLSDLIRSEHVAGTYAFLSWEDPHDRLTQFLQDRFQLSPDDRRRKIEENKDLVRSIITQTQGQSAAPKRLFMFDPSVVEVPFHLWCTSSRAIIAIALSYPSADIGKIRRRDINVIGFETADSKIIEQVKDGLRARLESSMARQYSPAVRETQARDTASIIPTPPPKADLPPRHNDV